MKSKKPSLYDAQEEQIQLQSASFVDFLTRKGVLEDHNIDNERVRKAKKDTAQRAYHNTEVLLSQYRLIIWVLECIPGELSDELEVPVHDIDALAEKIDIQTSLENARIESRVNAMMKTRYLVDRIHEALAVIRKKPGNGEDLYSVLYTTYLSSLFFSFLFIKLTRFADLSPGGRCPVPVNLILDEFNNIGRIGGAPDGSDFCRSLSVIRSRDIRVMLAVQSLGQLQNRYPNNLWSEIIGNCDIQLMLGCTDDVTADYISDRSGEMCIVVDSTMTVKKTVAVTQVIPQYRETQGQGKRKLLTPDEVLRLPHEQMLVIIRGQNLLLLNKFDYTRHPMSKEMVRASIMDYCPRTSYAPTPQTGSENEPDKKPQRESRGRKLSRSDTPPVEF